LKNMIGLAGIALVFLPVAHAQPPRAFEVASIRPNHSGATDSNVDSTRGGRLTVTNESLKDLIRLAFGVKDYQISGAPGWIDSERYDIAAKADSSGKTSYEDEKSLLRALLADRFALMSHVETRESAVYSLRIGKNGPKLTPHDDGTGTTARTTCGHMIGRRVTTAVLATMLSRLLEHDVSDQTGLSGKYDFQLDWTPNAGPCRDSPDDKAGSSEYPSIFTAVQERLGSGWSRQRVSRKSSSSTTWKSRPRISCQHIPWPVVRSA
jgi:uncharacterized protein (TIGR03435 family)